MRIIREPIIVAILALSPMAASAAVNCDRFKVAISEGAAQYQVPAPKFRLEEVNSADANNQFFSILMFDDARAMFLCSHDEVETFAVEAKSAASISVVHAMLLAGMGFHGYGLEWRQALIMRDRLVSLAKSSEAQMSGVRIEGGKASLGISVAGVPSFQIETDH
jgi:hypothetical protein